MARRGYPPEFRQRVVALVEAGRRVSDVAAELEVSEQTFYTWRRQARTDAGLEAGVTAGERAELASANRRIRELETDLTIHRRATELLKEKSDPETRPALGHRHHRASDPRGQGLLRSRSRRLQPPRGRLVDR